jgi:hypothetical protein
VAGLGEGVARPTPPGILRGSEAEPLARPDHGGWRGLAADL